MAASKWRWAKRIGIAAVLLALLTTASVPFVIPVMAAYACPSCYGLERAESSLYVEAAMPAAERQKLQEGILSAEAKTAQFYGSYSGHPTLLACMTEVCDHKLGGRGARATTYPTLGDGVIRVAPLGLNETILSHEFSHVELHSRIGIAQWLRGAVPAWFDEGVAVIVSEDARYLKEGVGAQKCKEQPAGALPETPPQWAALAGRTPGLYAHAACAVLLWLEANGGRPGLLAALAQVGQGARRLP